MERNGRNLLRDLKHHVLGTLAGLAGCDPEGAGAAGRAIKAGSGLSLSLPSQDGWLTWSIVVALVEEGAVEELLQGKRRQWRLTQSGMQRAI